MNNELILFWNSLAAQVMNLYVNPGRDSRRFAMFQIAIHNALNTINERFRRYAFYDLVDRSALAEAAVNSAAKKMLLWAVKDIGEENLPAGVSAGIIIDAYDTKMRDFAINGAWLKGVEIGQRSAKVIKRLRKGDGATTLPTATSNPPEGQAPREFRTDYYQSGVPGAMALPTNKLMVLHSQVPLFVMEANDQFQQMEDPPGLREANYRKDFREVKEMGSDRNGGPASPLSADLKHRTDYWSNVKQHILLNDLVVKIIRTQNLDAWQTARVLALVHTAMADGAICMFHDLYRIYQGRPVTAIQLSADDGDPNWKPYKSTPRVPENPTFFGVAGGAIQQILKGVIGSNTIPTIGLSNGVQSLSYSQIDAAIEDNAFTKINCGWNFRTTVEKSLKQGQEIGEYVYQNAFFPIT